MSKTQPVHTCSRVTRGPWDPAGLHVTEKWLRVHLSKQSRSTSPAQWVSVSPQPPQPFVPPWDSRELPASGSRLARL